MAKTEKPRQQEVVGWYQPHIAVDWDGLVMDKKTGELVKEPSLTKQSFKEECDINTIVRRFEATGQLDHINQAFNKGLYEDLPDGIDLQAAYNMINQAEQGFMALPAAVRARFDNDPVRFVDFVSDPYNQEEVIKMGLASDTRPPKAPDSAPEAEPAVKPKE